MNIHTLDLNLLLVFQAIHATRSVTLAGDRLGMTQSAVSNALKRLRERFNDPMFVRTLDGMVPTPLAERLIGPAGLGLAQIAQALRLASQFQPEQSDRLFRIALNEVGHRVMMPALFKAVRAQAPGVRLETVALSPAETRQHLMNGQVDLAIGSWAGMGPAFYQQRLFEESFVVVMCQRNRLIPHGFDADAYAAAQHLAFRPHGATDTELESTLSRAGMADKRHVVLGSAHASGLAQMLAGTDLLLTLPRRLAGQIAQGQVGLRVVDMPFAVTPFQIRQQWHERVQHDGAHRWLRELVFGLFSDAPEAARPAVLSSRRDWVREAVAA